MQSVADHIHKILGKGALRLSASMFEDIVVLSAFRHVFIWNKHALLWDGILDLDLDGYKLENLQAMYPELDVRTENVSHGLHY